MQDNNDVNNGEVKSAKPQEGGTSLTTQQQHKVEDHQSNSTDVTGVPGPVWGFEKIFGVHVPTY